MNECNNCAKRRDIERECPWGGTYHRYGEHGKGIRICNAYKQESNADHIRAMSDEELLAFMLRVVGNAAMCHLLKEEPQFLTLEWLQQPAKEE